MGDLVAFRRNVNDRVVDSFGHEWSRFDNRRLDRGELLEMFEAYTPIFPFGDLPEDAIGFDAGCGSGRWARFFAERVGTLHCVDASEKAVDVARRTLAGLSNVCFHHEDLTEMSIPSGSCDFGYSLGVLHHVPDTERALRACVDRLKPGAPFLVYLYYRLEDAGLGRRLTLRMVTLLRYVVARLPRRLKSPVTDCIAVFVYFPLARMAALFEKMGGDPSHLPLFQYRGRSFYVMRNDALDRFGTRLEKRFTQAEIMALLTEAGLDDIKFSEDPPWWVAVGHRSSGPNDR